MEVVIGVPRMDRAMVGECGTAKSLQPCELGAEEELWDSSPPTAAPRGYPVGRKESLE